MPPALDRCGYRPRLVVGNGLDGAGLHKPADRTIATMGARSIPEAWMRETQPTGMVSPSHSALPSPRSEHSVTEYLEKVDDMTTWTWTS
ncbi:hypothetical protein ACIHCV_31775 [Streptomyces sp. NPDC051956]|uniref:hypothetical protein n=1 Tax=Streptomyces sp. NPDC051956 TaxID=3365677 RepID=UPI0037D18789